MGEINILYMTFPENLIFTRIICFKTNGGRSVSFYKSTVKEARDF